MAQTVCVIPSAADLTRLSAIVADRARPLEHIQRARIVLLSAERLGFSHRPDEQFAGRWFGYAPLSGPSNTACGMPALVPQAAPSTDEPPIGMRDPFGRA